MKVGGQTVELELPARPAIRHAIAVAANQDRHHEQIGRVIVAAALLLCWPSVSHKAGVPRWRSDIREFGDQALDYLLGLGATMPEIIRAGNAAIEMVATDSVTVRQMEEARGNSSAPGGSSNGGGSSDGTRTGPTDGSIA